ncbi:ATP-dependent 6-phosphofructokinase [Piscinibacter sakaiensis]|uniref:ATP-dependent 6-phosphofructokinase n=1 Tax=Piscinibacter sakaiensis TaxID=1547922 RepID=UPI003AAE2DAF
MAAVQKVAVLTSGGDAPGMNAAIRAVVRAGISRGAEMFGVEHGYTGLMSGSLTRLGARDVGGIIQRGGTMLGTTRCAELKTPAGLDKAVATLRELGISGLVVIGGNGSQSGAAALDAKGVAVVGVASTIDNDLYGTDITIGATTAADIALEAIDRLRVTAASHQRAFLVEVMGRQCGYLALMAGIAGGAEAILVPEVETDPETVARELCEARERGKSHAIVVVAEGARYNAASLAEHFNTHGQRLGFELRVSLLGHIQRGGSPGVFDRMLATRLGAGAVERLLGGHHGELVGMVGGKLVTTRLSEVAGRSRPVDPQWIELARMLAV